MELAAIAEREGEFLVAERYLHDARSLDLALGQDNLGVLVLSQLARLALAEDRVAHARGWSNAMVERLEELGEDAGPMMTAGLGWLAAAEGDIGGGMALLEQGVDQARMRGEPRGAELHARPARGSPVAGSTGAGEHCLPDASSWPNGAAARDQAGRHGRLCACLVTSGQTARMPYASWPRLLPCESTSMVFARPSMNGSSASPEVETPLLLEPHQEPDLTDVPRHPAGDEDRRGWDRSPVRRECVGAGGGTAIACSWVVRQNPMTEGDGTCSERMLRPEGVSRRTPPAVPSSQELMATVLVVKCGQSRRCRQRLHPQRRLPPYLLRRG